MKLHLFINNEQSLNILKPYENILDIATKTNELISILLQR